MLESEYQQSNLPRWLTLSSFLIIIIIIIINQQRKRTCRILDFAVPVDHRVKLKECEKRDKYLDIARELKKKVKHESDDYTNCKWHC